MKWLNNSLDWATTESRHNATIYVSEPDRNTTWVLIEAFLSWFYQTIAELVNIQFTE